MTYKKLNKTEIFTTNKNLISRAKGYLEKEDHDKAIECLDTVQNTTTDNDVLKEIADLYEKADVIGYQFNCYNKIKNNHPTNKDLLTIVEKYLGSPFYPFLATECIDEILKNNPTNDILFEIAAKYYNLENYNESIKYYDKILVNEPESENVLFERARVNTFLNNYKKAIVDWEKCSQTVNLNKIRPIILNNMAYCYMQLDDDKKAIEILNSDDSKLYITHYNKSICYFELNQYNKALNEIDFTLNILQDESLSGKKNILLFLKSICNFMLDKKEEFYNNAIILIDTKTHDLFTHKDYLTYGFEDEIYQDQPKEIYLYDFQKYNWTSFLQKLINKPTSTSIFYYSLVQIQHPFC